MKHRRHVISLCSGLEANVQWYRKFLKKVIDCKRVLGQRAEKKELAEMVILRLCATWEYYSENILVACVSSDTTKLSKLLNVKLEKMISISLAEACLFGTEYKDFRSVGDLKGYAKKVIVDNYNPFNNIDAKDEAKIDQMFNMRNYLSHYSAKSKRALAKLYKNALLKGAHREPGNFLISYKGKLIFEFCDSLVHAAAELKNIAI